MNAYDRDNDVQGANPDTPYHKRLRADQSIRPIRYGFYPVVTESRKFEQCSICNKEILGEAYRLNGELKCNGCMSARI